MNLDVRGPFSSLLSLSLLQLFLLSTLGVRGPFSSLLSLSPSPSPSPSPSLSLTALPSTYPGCQRSFLFYALSLLLLVFLPTLCVRC